MTPFATHTSFYLAYPRLPRRSPVDPHDLITYNLYDGPFWLDGCCVCAFCVYSGMQLPTAPALPTTQHTRHPIAARIFNYLTATGLRILNIYFLTTLPSPQVIYLAYGITTFIYRFPVVDSFLPVPHLAVTLPHGLPRPTVCGEFVDLPLSSPLPTFPYLTLTLTDSPTPCCYAPHTRTRLLTPLPVGMGC